MNLLISLLIIFSTLIIAPLKAENIGDISYKKRANEIVDIWFEKKEGFAKQISYLPNFNEKDINDWRALLYYGYFHTQAASELGNQRIIYFINEKSIIKPSNFYSFTESIRNKIFANYSAYPGKVFIFQVNPYKRWKKKYFQSYFSNTKILKEHHIGVVD